MKCVKCGTELAETALVCHACGHLLPRPDDLQMAPATERPRSTLFSDLQPDDDAADMHPPLPDEDEVHQFAADRRWPDYILPAIFLTVGLVTYLTIFGIRFGGSGAALIATDIAAALLLELPLAVAIVAIAGAVFHINLGLLGPGILKLAALTLVQRGLALAVAWIIVSGVTWQGEMKGDLPPEVPTAVRGDSPEEEDQDGQEAKLQTEREARARARLQAGFQAALLAFVGFIFLIWFLKTVFDLSIYELIVVWGVNLLFSALLYAGTRLLLQLPRYVF